MTDDVNRDLLRKRFESYIVDSYTGLHNTVVSVVLAIAGLSAASLAGSHAQYGHSYPLLWILWLAGLLLCATIFAGTMSGSAAMPPLMPTITDILLPLPIAVGEFVLFGVLAHQITGLNQSSSIAEAWFISLTFICLCAAAAITRAMRSFRGATYAAEIIEPIDEYRFRRLPADRTGALVTALMGIVGAIASTAQVTWLEYVLGVCIAVGLLFGLRGHARSAALLRTAMRHGCDPDFRDYARRSSQASLMTLISSGVGWPGQDASNHAAMRTQRNLAGHGVGHGVQQQSAATAPTGNDRQRPNMTRTDL